MLLNQLPEDYDIKTYKKTALLFDMGEFRNLTLTGLTIKFVSAVSDR